jgi:FlaA1/EpsC-like NDP-sugar epimerase
MHKKILEMSRYYKRALLIAIDLTLLSITIWVALSLRFGVLYVPPTAANLALVVAAPLIAIGMLWRFQVYRVVTRFVGYRVVSQIALSLGIATLVWSLIVFMAGQYGIPRSVIIPYWLCTTLLLVGTRYAIKLVIESVELPTGAHYPALRDPPKPTLIYGADRMGLELLQNVRRARDREIVGFVDSSPTLWRQYVAGVKVYAPNRMERVIERAGVREVLVALPGNQKRERREVLRVLGRLPVTVKVLPAYEDLTSGHVDVNSLRDVDVNDLLGRDPVRPRPELLARSTTGKSVLVTGAGGSIGSELVRQVVRQSPRLIVLLDISEPALYRIEMEISALLEKLPEDVGKPRLRSVLGSVTDPTLVMDTLIENKIETIYHAAAYKHVPIVERNPASGIENNVLGTQIMAECASKLGVERFVLISTDKAVRPTNIMGASKRLAELVLQAEAAEQPKTVFTAVRFGNVLDSSGSVIPRFKEQIRTGGPLTVTHPDITRYFMSIPEAAELVVQAGAMATGGEVFVLQMGNPVRIADLARLLIRLSNLEVRDETNPDGDIGIVYTGLRPGEKLYEELLIGARTETTEHPRIFKSDEPFLTSAELKREIADLRLATGARDATAIKAVLSRTVEGYMPAAAVPESGLAEREDAVAPLWGTPSQTVH